MSHKANFFSSAGLLVLLFFSLLGLVGCGNTQIVYQCADGTQQDTPCPTPTTGNPTAPVPHNTPTVPVPIPTTGTDPLNLSAQEVQKWCSPIPNGTGTCDISRFQRIG